MDLGVKDCTKSSYLFKSTICAKGGHPLASCYTVSLNLFGIGVSPIPHPFSDLLIALHCIQMYLSDERKTMEMKRELENATIHKLKNVNADEYTFWEQLTKECLLPTSKAYGLEDELKGKTILIS